ncbi:keratin-3, type I cytoskeletal 51 kDa-like [Teleopsis dalmanni]|uniref:keratin-3, type I cytoskeletal 51 kDa-like n=1 Tax=Teleopsis dalmanni TaxID=139649 RepID=UPI0018CD2751|nr:keratin-3, type I cytoskeletal 51 kDa-like [Teleopsis dalmanni]
MAFSTQTEFFKVAFLDDEEEDVQCERVCINLKRYESTEDLRSWSIRPNTVSRYLTDLVRNENAVCESGNANADGDAGDGSGGKGKDKSAVDADARRGRGYGSPGASTDATAGAGGKGKGKDRTADKVGVSGDGGPGRARDADAGKGPGKGVVPATGPGGGPGRGGDQGVGAGPKAGPSARSGAGPDAGAGKGPGQGSGPGTSGAGAGKGAGAGAGSGRNLKGGDSLVELASEQLSKMTGMLHKQGKMSKDGAGGQGQGAAPMDVNTLKKNLAQKPNDSCIDELNKKVKSLVSANKINSSDESDFMKIKEQMEKIRDGYDALRAENVYLQQIVEKCSPKPGSNVAPETSTDTKYLQNEVNKLRSQLSTSKSGSGGYTDKEVEAINTIVAERNSLRNKLKDFKSLESKMADLQSKSREADNLSASLSNSLDSQSEYIENMEEKYRQMQEFYREKLCECMMSGQTLEMQLREMKKELCSDMYEIQKLEMQNSALRNEIMYKDVALCNYETLCKQIKYKAKLFRNSGYSMQRAGEMCSCQPNCEKQ